jgi:uncharacterized membrane protein YphA (DoxX/SURF4 family)
MQGVPQSLSPTILRLAVGGISILVALKLLHLIGPEPQGEEFLINAIKAFAERIAATGLPLAVPLAWLWIACLVIGAPLVLLGLFTRTAALALLFVWALGLITGPSVWELDIAEKSTRVVFHLCTMMVAVCISLVLTGPGSLAIHSPPEK